MYSYPSQLKKNLLVLLLLYLSLPHTNITLSLLLFIAKPVKRVQAYLPVAHDCLGSALLSLSVTLTLSSLSPSLSLPSEPQIELP